MTEEQGKLLGTLKENISALKEQYIMLREAYQELKTENDQRRTDLNDLQKNYSELQHEFEMLKISKAFSGSNEEREGMKKKIGLMVREIDNCISLLNE